MLNECIEICHEGGCMSSHEYYRGKQRPVHHTTLDKSDKISQTDRQTQDKLASPRFCIFVSMSFLLFLELLGLFSITRWELGGRQWVICMMKLALIRQLDVHRIEMTCFYHTLMEPLWVSWGACHFPFCFVYTWFDDRFYNKRSCTLLWGLTVPQDTQTMLV